MVCGSVLRGILRCHAENDFKEDSNTKIEKNTRNKRKKKNRKKK